MRYLAFIFSIYILALSAWPCCSDETSLSSIHGDVCLSESKHQNENHDHPEACSPFFHASTYHAFIIAPAINNTSALVTVNHNSNYPEYESAAISHFPGDIWQPPQLA